MKKLLSALAMFILFCSPGLAQQEKPAQISSFHFELAGTGGLYSLSLERSFGKKNMFVQPGVSVFPNNHYTMLVIPVMVKKHFGSNKHKLETGIGQGLSFAFGEGLHFFPRGLLLIGWRYETENSPWIFRVSYTPMLSYLVDWQYQHWGGISIGYRLKSKT